MYHDDPIKKVYDDAIRKCVEELKVIERNARACSEVVGYHNGTAMRLQASVAEAMYTALQGVIDNGGMPPLKEIGKLMEVPVMMVIPKAELSDTELKRWFGEVRDDCAEELDEKKE